MRVLHVGCVLDPQRRSGAALLEAWPTLLDVARAARDAGADVSVLQAAHADEVLERDGIRVRFVAEHAALRAAAGRTGARVPPIRLARAAAAAAPDVVHVNGLAFPLHARAIAAALPRAALLVQDHGDRPPHRRRALHRWGLAVADGAAFVSREQAAPFLAQKLLSADLPLFEIAESSSRFQPGDAAQARLATGVRGDPAVLWIGRLDAVKDPLVALDAFALAAERLPDARLWCCFTDAPLLERVRSRVAKDPRLGERVRLLGRVPHEHVEQLCRACDLLLLTSRREGCPYALLEALACGLPAVLSDLPAHRALTHGADTTPTRAADVALTQPGDAAAAAAAIVRLAGGLRETRRRRLRRHFERDLSFDALGRRLLACYRTLLRRAA